MSPEADPTESVPAESLIPAVIHRLIDATNAGDSGLFITCFADDGVVDDRGRKFAGHDAIASWDEAENVGTNNRFQIVGVLTNGPDVTLEMEVTGDGITGPSRAEFVLDGNLIQRMTIRS